MNEMSLNKMFVSFSWYCLGCLATYCQQTSIPGVITCLLIDGFAESSHDNDGIERAKVRDSKLSKSFVRPALSCQFFSVVL